jgi:hypothetical protein
VTRRSSSTSNLSPFNPFSATPLECPSVNTAGPAPPGTVCTVAGYNWFKGPNFGKATGPGSYQTPRVYAFSAGLRF